LRTYKPSTISTVPILSLVLEFYIKHSVGEKISSHLRDADNCDMEIKLKEKSGTYKTFLRMNFSLKKTITKQESITKFPLGSLIIIGLI